jgi:hypothetical protein
LLCKICLPETVQAFLELPYALELQAATFAGAGSFLQPEPGERQALPHQSLTGSQGHTLYTLGRFARQFDTKHTLGQECVSAHGVSAHLKCDRERIGRAI